MAISYSHKFGQIIGDLLELAVEPGLHNFCQANNLFLDKKGVRLARAGKKVSWIDINGNIHDLDFVIEKNGAGDKLGAPVAFIEIAWRRYTKHSKNKAQEIQGAIMPLIAKYNRNSPFAGAILAGEFTEPALNQLKSLGFSILYFPYKTVIAAFAEYGIDASFNEATDEVDFQNKIAKWESLVNQNRVAEKLISINRAQVDEFFNSLRNAVTRSIESVVVLPLHGIEYIADSIVQAILLIETYEETIINTPILRYEIIIKYNTGDRIDANFRDKADALKFLQGYI